MMISLIDRQARAGLLAQIEDINSRSAAAWGLAIVKRENLKDVTNDTFLLAVKPALAQTADARIYVLENGDFYILWLGMQKRVYQAIDAIVASTLRRAEAAHLPGAIYADPLVMANELVAFLRRPENPAPVHHATRQALLDDADDGTVDPTSFAMLKPTAQQRETFRRGQAQRGWRRQLQILVVEDQTFLRMMLKQILVETHNVDLAAGIREGWELFLNKAPDIVFLDIGLEDGNGHALAQAIKWIDPATYVVMVTAHNQKAELQTALSNRVDGYVIKPYNRQQIAGYVSKYLGNRRATVETEGHA